MMMDICKNGINNSNCYNNNNTITSSTSHLVATEIYYSPHSALRELHEACNGLPIPDSSRLSVIVFLLVLADLGLCSSSMRSATEPNGGGETSSVSSQNKDFGFSISPLSIMKLCSFISTIVVLAQSSYLNLYFLHNMPHLDTSIPKARSIDCLLWLSQ